MNKLIELNFHPIDFEEILLTTDKVNYFRNKEVRDSFPSMIFFTLLFVILVIAETLDQVYYFFYIIIVPFWIYFTISYFKTTRNIYMYKMGIKQWLDHISSFTNHSIELTNNSISLVMDDQITIQTWSSLNYCRINNQRVILQGEEQFFFPSKSMSSDDYKILIKFIESNIKNSEQLIEE